MEDGICTVRTPKPERRTIGQIPLANGLYRVSIATNGSPRSDLALAVSGKMSINELHRKMGHINHDDLHHMVKEGTITGIDLDTSLRLNSVPDVLGEKRHRNRFRNWVPVIRQSDMVIRSYQTFGDLRKLNPWRGRSITSYSKMNTLMSNTSTSSIKNQKLSRLIKFTRHGLKCNAMEK